MKDSDLLLSLQRSNLFKNKTKDEIRHLLSNINYRIHCYDKKQIVFSYNQSADTMGILISGCVHVEKLLPCGKVVIITKKDDYSLIAEPSIFATIKFYDAIVTVYGKSTILLLHKNALLKLFTLDSAIMHNFLESVSNSMITLKNKISILSHRSIQARLSHYLIDSFNKEKSKEITLPFSKKALAEYLNVSRPSLSRELKILQDKNILSFKNRSFKIINIDALNNILLNDSNLSNLINPKDS
ncbi:Crp/Fnr family transcriptional regulator [Clostridiaceae bacterium M8S5]|nr:Crp/Fnr family transcriptional regulator [Clostridiaceae bacterium M8S5]